MQLVDGRPGNTEGRLDKEIRVYDFSIHSESRIKEWTMRQQ